MKTQKVHNIENKVNKSTNFLCILGTALVLSLSACGGGSGGGTSSASINPGTCAADLAPLISDASLETQSLLEHEHSTSSPGTFLRRFVHIDTTRIRELIRAGARKLRLRLFSDLEVDLQLDEVRSENPLEVTATGRLNSDDESTFSLSAIEEALALNIRDSQKNRIYEIRLQADGTHRIEAIDTSTVSAQASGLASGNGDCLALPAPQDSQDDSHNFAEHDQDDILADPMIDILVAYTPAARTRAGGTNGILALIKTGIADTNRAFSDSGIGLRVRLVGTLALTQNETSNFSGDLAALRSTSDGKWDQVHSERNRLGADQVTLVGAYSSNSSTNGIGYIGATRSSAFSIVRVSSFSQFTPAHELGHNLGLNHSDGLQSTAGRFRTIMAYGSYPRIRRFSNPALRYNGYATGTSSKNSARIVNRNAARVAGLVPSLVPIDGTVGGGSIGGGGGDDSGGGDGGACPI